MKVNGYRFYRYGGPEVLIKEKIILKPPSKDEAIVRHTAIGVNFFDIYARKGEEKIPLPNGVGIEGAGIVEEVGADVKNVVPGDRVAYGPVIGSYQEARLIPAWRLVKLPDAVSDEIAAASMVKGMTVQYLLKQIGNLQVGDTILFHAAAGGVGFIAGQWAKALGITIIGTVGSDEKVVRAKAHGYNHVINYRIQNFQKEVMEITNGAGVKIVYDSIGKETFEASLNCIAPTGGLIAFGAASGLRPRIDIETLAHKGSIFIQRPTLRTYAGTPEGLARCSSDVLRVLIEGTVKVEVLQRYALKDAPQAHADLETRKTMGSTILLP
jgi:NADPH:quinone reductase